MEVKNIALFGTVIIGGLAIGWASSASSNGDAAAGAAPAATAADEQPPAAAAEATATWNTAAGGAGSTAGQANQTTGPNLVEIHPEDVDSRTLSNLEHEGRTRSLPPLASQGAPEAAVSGQQSAPSAAPNGSWGVQAGSQQASAPAPIAASGAPPLPQP